MSPIVKATWMMMLLMAGCAGFVLFLAFLPDSWGLIAAFVPFVVLIWMGLHKIYKNEARDKKRQQERGW